MIQTVTLHADAPAKPAEGEFCNGCGICCVVEPCPVAWLLLPLRKGSCAALQWHGESKRYRCGMVANPKRYLAWLPRRWEDRASRWFASRIAAGRGCDYGATEVRDI